MKLRDYLADFPPESLNRLLERRGLPRNGGQEAKRTRLARSYRADLQQLVDDCSKEELKILLKGEWAVEGVDYELAGLNTASLSELRAAADEIVLGTWWPEQDDEQVSEAAGRIRARLVHSIDDVDDDVWEDEDDDEDEAWEDDEVIRSSLPSFTSTEYTQEFWAELAFRPEKVKQLRPYQSEAKRALLKELARAPATPWLLHIATGGGKTLIANEVVKEYLGQFGGPVLWITKDWRLLKQAAIDLCTREDGINKKKRIGRIGGRHGELAPLSEESLSGVVYTTLHTFLRRSGPIAQRFKPRLVVWDECHWGEDAKTGRRLLAFCKRRGIPLLGLTATPRRPEHTKFEIAFSKDFASLIAEQWLAEPSLHEPFETGIEWAPRIRHRQGDFLADSLAELGRNRRRNEIIVRHYAQHASGYGKTIVFACDIQHADMLAQMFTSLPGGGVPARPVHSAMSPVEVRHAIDEFRRGAVQVLVNVAMLTTGVDFPDAKSIFLCRPTKSDILFSQMIGRGSRRHEPSGKTSFHVIEFTDNLTRFQDQLVTTKKFFQGTTARRATSDIARPVQRTPRPREHQFDLEGAPTWIPDQPSVPEVLRGLWYRHGQTFGVELELTSRGFHGHGPDAAWKRVAEELRLRLAQRLPELVAHNVQLNPNAATDHSVWNVTYDRSAGWEVISRVLSNQEGFEELAVACDALTQIANDLDLRVNHRTGLHVHLGWLGRDLDEVKRAIQLAKIFEPALATLVSPSRIRGFDGHTYAQDQANPYCYPVSTFYSRRILERATTFAKLRAMGEEDDARYVSFNVVPLEHIHTVEVRLHNGTTEAKKVLLWLSLWQQILWAAAHHHHVPPVEDIEVIEPSGDIIALARQFLPQAPRPFLHRLDERRQEICSHWAQAPALEHWLSYNKHWERPA